MAPLHRPGWREAGVSGGYLRRPPTVVLSVAPAANLGVFDALILTGSPVRGLRPERAARLDTENLPRPVIATSSPFFRVLATVVVREFTARVASARDSPLSLAIASINSLLFQCLLLLS